MKRWSELRFLIQDNKLLDLVYTVMFHTSLCTRNNNDYIVTRAYIITVVCTINSQVFGDDLLLQPTSPDIIALRPCVGAPVVYLAPKRVSNFLHQHKKTLRSR